MLTLRSRLEDRVQSKHLLTHSFFSRWGAGQLTSDEIKGYVKECYMIEREFPRFISALHSRCEDPQIRQALLETLVHQEQGGNNELETWTRFAEALGVEKTELLNHFFSDETRHLIKVLQESVTSENPIDGHAAIFAYERQKPDIARTKISGLRMFYGLKDDDSVDQFRENRAKDVLYAETEAHLLHQLCKSEADESRAVEMVDKILDSLHDFLDGIERRYRH